jgi:hypothetical protein
MARYVIDAPTLLQLIADDVEVHGSHQLVAPNVIRTEALTLLLAAVRRGDMTEPSALAQHERMTVLKMRLLGDRVSRRTAWKVATEQNWGTSSPLSTSRCACCRLTHSSRSITQWRAGRPASCRWPPTLHCSQTRDGQLGFPRSQGYRACSRRSISWSSARTRRRWRSK